MNDDTDDKDDYARGLVQPQASKTRWWLGGLAAAGVAGLAYAIHRSVKTDAEPTDLGASGGDTTTGGATTGDNTTGGSTPGSTNNNGSSAAGWSNVRPLPTAADVPGFDLQKNWGKTPADLRPLFALMERLSGIDGAGRLFSAIAKRESGFVPTAHNDSAAERNASRRAYTNAKDRNPTLSYGAQAAEFGSGGLFAGLAPYFLWTGVPEVGDRAPLLTSPPEIMFLPRVAAFGACVYLQRLVAYYRLDDHLDVKVGWASPSLLKNDRGGATYKAVRARFNSDVIEVGIDLDDTSTIPAKLSAARWPGVPKLFADLVGTLPIRK
jgi:hypothetical protein